MLFILSARDNSFRQTIEADDLDQALLRLADHFEYHDYEQMLEGLKYSPGDIEFSVLVDERNKQPESFNLDNSVGKQVMRAFKALRQ